jgi:hypothetical protein
MVRRQAFNATIPEIGKGRKRYNVVVGSAVGPSLDRIEKGLSTGLVDGSGVVCGACVGSLNLRLRGTLVPSTLSLGDTSVEVVRAANEGHDRLDDLVLAVPIPARLYADHDDANVEVARALAVAIHAVLHAP